MAPILSTIQVAPLPVFCSGHFPKRASFSRVCSGRPSGRFWNLSFFARKNENASAPLLPRPPSSRLPAEGGSGATRFFLPRRILARRVAQSRDPSSVRTPWDRHSPEWRFCLFSSLLAFVIPASPLLDVRANPISEAGFVEGTGGKAQHGLRGIFFAGG
jgi:hypothetical protein